MLFIKILFALYVLKHPREPLKPITSNCNLTPTIDKLVHLQHHRFLVNASAEVCVVTTNVSTLSESHPNVMSTLISQHPVKFATEKPVKYVIKPKYANVVLLDATGWDKFPVLRLVKQFSANPCHTIDARFIVLVTRSCFLTDRSAIVQFFDGQGIVNYVIFPTPSSASDPVDNISLYTENRFSKEEIYVPLGDLDNLHRLFPNKLTNLHGYPIRIGVIREDYPYATIYDEGTLIIGIVWKMFEEIGAQTLNLTPTMSHQTTDRYDADVYYDITLHREHFQHEFAFREMGGMCLSCPRRYSKQFLPHLLKPFSLGVWIFLGGVFIVCYLLRFLFPTTFRYDLISQTLFGVFGHEYNHAYPARAVLFALSLLSFFFSRTYCSKILALMSLGKFYSRPETIADFMHSDYMLAVHKETLAQYVLDDFVPKMLPQDEFETLRKQVGSAYSLKFCVLEPCGIAYLLTSSWPAGVHSSYFVIKEKVIPNVLKLHFANKSPIFTVMKRYLGLYYDTGLWAFYFHKYLFILQEIPEEQHTIKQVVFLFDDLSSVWMLLIGGWTVSSALFLMELFSKKRP